MMIQLIFKKEYFNFKERIKDFSKFVMKFLSLKTKIYEKNFIPELK